MSKKAKLARSKGGKSKSLKKADAARVNGKKGGPSKWLKVKH